MKKTIFTLGIAAVFAACNNQQATQATGEQAVSLDSLGTTYIVDTNSTVLNWEGVAAYGSHNGTVKVKEGKITVNEGTVTAGSFTINMGSIRNLDLADAKKNADLVGHLNSEDFFDTKKYPEGKFEVTSVEAITNDTAGNTHKISGNLTLKGITKNITFPAKVNITDEALSANGTIVIDRLQWNITYRSIEANPTMKAKLKDIAIRDEFKIEVALQAKKG